jgi:hypothetical protein
MDATAFHCSLSATSCHLSTAHGAVSVLSHTAVVMFEEASECQAALIPITISCSRSCCSSFFSSAWTWKPTCTRCGSDLTPFRSAPRSLQTVAAALLFVAHCAARHPVAVKLYDRRSRLTHPQSPGDAAGSIEQLMTGALARELCIIARANREFHHVCR